MGILPEALSDTERKLKPLSRICVTEMATPPIPNRCIWCLKEPPEATFNVSHVLPECVGNKDQQVLPPGIVCQKCNQYFGNKVEPTLLADPLFHAIAVFLQVVDPDDMQAFRNRLFDSEHPPDKEVLRDFKLNAGLNDHLLQVDVAYTIKGSMTKHYDQRSLSMLSRAVHKIGFESLAWHIFCAGSGPQIDLFSDTFGPVRRWARDGQPMSVIRPVLRRPSQKISENWESRVWRNSDGLAIELKIFADWYALSLTSDSTSALADLRQWISQAPDDTWVITDRIAPLDRFYK